VHAYACSENGLNGLPYIIMDYVDGLSLTDLGYGSGEIWGLLTFGGPQTPASKHVYQQIADVLVQLRQLEFSQIGALGLPSRDTSALTCNPDDITVRNRPLSIVMALQDLDGLDPSAAFPPKTPLSTAKEFVDGLLWLADNKLKKEPDQGMERREPPSILYAAHHFKRFVLDKWLDLSANEGPFVLCISNSLSLCSNYSAPLLPVGNDVY
jgi:hypothetical protein